MPPFKADNSFQHYKNENYLSPDEINIIQDWITGGAKKGKNLKKLKSADIDVDIHSNQLKANSQTVESSVQNTIVVPMGKAFEMPELGKEEFRFFHLPVNNKDTKYIQSIRFVPGNRKLVHHSRIMCDTTGLISGINGMSENDSAIYSYQTKPLADPFLFGWVPGNDQISFP